MMTVGKITIHQRQKEKRKKVLLRQRGKKQSKKVQKLTKLKDVEDRRRTVQLLPRKKQRQRKKVNSTIWKIMKSPLLKARWTPGPFLTTATMETGSHMESAESRRRRSSTRRIVMKAMTQNGNHIKGRRKLKATLLHLRNKLLVYLLKNGEGNQNRK